MAKLGKALMSLLLDKKARDALEAKAAVTKAYQQQRAVERERPPQAAPQATPQSSPARHPSQDEINARLDKAQQASVNRTATPGRKQLIQQAMQVRATKAKMLDDLPEDQRLKLKAMAMMSFMKARP